MYDKIWELTIGGYHYDFGISQELLNRKQRALMWKPWINQTSFKLRIFFIKR